MKKTNIEVHARIRPVSQTDGPYDPTSLCLNDNTSIVVNNEKGSDYTYRMNQCYGQESTQEDVFAQILPLTDRVLTGANASIFCYGVTGSGKTHTMQGNDQDPGIIPRTIENLFERTEAMEDRTTTLSFSYVEILKDTVYDLQTTSSEPNAGSSRRWSQSFTAPTIRPKLDLRTDSKGNTVIANMQITDTSSSDEFHSLYNKAAANRKTASTNLNHGSSRSHAILTIYVRMQWNDGFAQRSKICLTDLAGSENNNLTGNDPERMAESAAINTSLTTLRNVVEAIKKNAARIPYRDCKLTRILSDALGGTSQGLLICCLAPGAKFTKDTINTLEFATRTKDVQNRLSVNERTARRESTVPGFGRPASSMGAARASMAGPTRPRPASSLGLSPVRASVSGFSGGSSLRVPGSSAMRPLSTAGITRNMPLATRANALRPSATSNSLSIASGAAGRRVTTGYSGATAASRNKENVPHITVTGDQAKQHTIDEAFTKNGGMTRDEARAFFDQLRADTQEAGLQQTKRRAGVWIEDMTQDERTSRCKMLWGQSKRLREEGDLRGALDNALSAMLYWPDNDKLRLRTLELERQVEALGHPQPQTDVFGNVVTGTKRTRQTLEVLDEGSEMHTDRGSSASPVRESSRLPPPKRRMMSHSTSMRI